MRRDQLYTSICLSFVLASPIVGQASDTRFQLPDSVYGFSLADSTVLPGTQGTAYRYGNRAGVRSDVFVYAVPIERVNAPDSIQLASEAETFVAGLAYGTERGHYDAYEVPINKAMSITSGTGSSVPVRVVVMVFRRGRESFVSFMHLLLKDRRYVKVRLTLPFSQWRTSTDSNFALELAKRLFP
jgi:hypothetical protein